MDTKAARSWDTAWPKFDLHQVVIEPNATAAKKPRAGFKAARKLIRGKAPKRQYSIDSLLSITGGKPDVSIDLSQSFFPPRNDKERHKTQPIARIRSEAKNKTFEQVKTALSVLTFPSSSHASQLMKMLGATASPGFVSQDLGKSAESDFFKILDSRLDDPMYALKSGAHPKYVHTVEVKFKRTAGRVQQLKDPISALLSVVRAQKAQIMKNEQNGSRVRFLSRQKSVDWATDAL